MRVAILSRGPRLYTTRRLKEAAEQRGHVARVLNTLSFSIEVEQEQPRLYYRSRELRGYDAVIPRIGASITFFGAAVVRQFEQTGVFCVNPSHAISVSRDKLRALQVLSRHRVGIPKTVFVRNPSEILSGIERLGGAPVVVKLLEGTQGVGVILAETTKVAEAVIETLSGPAKMNVLLQQFVQESRGRDVRALVVGGRVVAAMRRVAERGEFRSNVHRGGRVEVAHLDDVYRATAVHAAQILGLRVAGVDMLEGRDGPVVMEVNSSPGLEGIERATGVDVAGEIVRLIEDEVLFPEVDLRQRLTLHKGYGVMEIPIAEGSLLCGKTIGTSGLRDRDVIVLTIQRGSLTIPNPRRDRAIVAGDVLLCFGKNLTLKSLAPPGRGARGVRRKPPRRAVAVARSRAAGRSHG
ncbi:MAG: 30S ribosomal protein S6--L-glutamate ligase [Deltaproteobacteria bacterium]|nr:30S ribosomal protein S6--L-glutamate ligase [Deltaproteobacteria bacterium]